MRIKIVVSYDGTDYCGWQVQPNGITVQQKIEEAVFLAMGEKVRVTGSGRTDAGVHAKKQVAHFDTNCTIPPQKIYKALNPHLPQDIKVISSELASDDFHACSSAKKKTYQYSFYLSEIENPLKERYAVKVERVDVKKMKDCAEIFVGEHDFKAFCASGSGAKTTVRKIYSVEISQNDCDIIITVTGNGFLYNMVRIMVGTLLLVGKSEMNKADVENMLKSGERSPAIRTLSAKGLCLTNVEY